MQRCSAGAKGLIIDLRDNGGGLVNSAIAVADELMEKGVVVSTLDHNGNKSSYTTAAGRTALPYVLLINGNTASASEIASGTLQDLKRGIIIGSRTYGKGLVQVPNVDLPYNANLKLTTSRYYLPSGRGIKMKEGIKPDVEVKPDTMANITLYLDRMGSGAGFVDIDAVLPKIAVHR